MTIRIEDFVNAIDKHLVLVSASTLLFKLHVTGIVPIDQADAESDVRFFLLATVHVDHHDNCVIAELIVGLGLNKLEEHVDSFLIFSERGPEHVATDCLLTRLQHCIHNLLHSFVLLVLNEWLEGPGHSRFVLDYKLESNLTPLNCIEVHEIGGDELGHLGLLLLVLSIICGVSLRG